MTDKSKQFPLTGEIHWAHIVEPNNKGEFPSHKYEADLAINKDTAMKLKSLGVEIKNKGDSRGEFVKLRSLFQPTMEDNDGNPMEVQKLGNGSRVTIISALYPNKAKQGGKQCLGMNKIKVIEKVDFETNLTSLDDLI